MLSSPRDTAFSIHDEFIQINKNEEFGVINHTCLIDLATQQIPTGEAGRLYREEGIKLNEIEEIRIEFLRILKIDHLWCMTNLIKLSLSHNTIEKIEQLDALTKLVELDLSFNSIKIIENLHCLTKLEILLLGGNQIAEIEGIDNLNNLAIFSIAHNKINGWEHVLYLRQFKNLRSLNVVGNPCTYQDNYNEYLIAFLPQVHYLSYVMIRDDDRDKAVKMYWRTIAKVEDDESKAQMTLDKEKALCQKNVADSKAFVDNLDGDTFFQLLFMHNKEAIALKNINDDTLSAFDEYNITFSIVCHELYDFGIEQHLQRVKEIEIFSVIVKDARDAVRDEARRTIDSIQKEKEDMVLNFEKEMDELDQKISKGSTITKQTDLQIDVKITKAQTFTEEFNQFLSTMWTKLLYNEVVLHEQIEDINETFKLNMADMRDVFIETVRALFHKIHNIIVEYRDTIKTVVSTYINIIEANESSIPTDLVDICGDMDILSNTLASAHDFHMQVIDNREDEIIRKTNNWYDNLISELCKEEHVRHRRRVLEISHFLQYQRESIQTHILTNNNLVLDVVAALDG